MTVWVVLLAVYFGLLTLSMFFRQHTLRGPWWYLLRAFFPNWQFYHQVGAVPHLYVRSAQEGGDWQDWVWVYPRQPRRFGGCFTTLGATAIWRSKTWSTICPATSRIWERAPMPVVW